MKGLKGFAQILIGCAILAGAAGYIHYDNVHDTPQARRIKVLEARKADLTEKIADAQRTIEVDNKGVYQSRLDSFDAEHHGPDSASMGRFLRAKAEQLREDNRGRLVKLKAKLAEVEAELRRIQFDDEEDLE